MSHWLPRLAVLFISVSMGFGVGPRIRSEKWEEEPPTTNYVARSETERGVRIDENDVLSRFSMQANVALLEELRTITELILRNQKEEKIFPPPPPVSHDCSTLYEAGIKASGVYSLFPFTFPVFCDMTTDGGGWTVFQRRLAQDIHEDFNRPWKDYRNGFGELEGEFWLGLESLHQLTHSSDFELRVDLMDFELGPKYALYEVFSVGPESDSYRLNVTGYSGTAGDALSRFHSGRRFSTYDRDQDKAQKKSCAVEKEGGWWFHACYAAHPNGVYPDKPERSSEGTEIRWWSDQEQVLILTAVELKIRRRRGHAPVPPLPTSPADTNEEAKPDRRQEDKRVEKTANDTQSDDDEHDWNGGNEVYPFGDINGNGEDEHNVTEHQGRSDVSPWEVAKASEPSED